MLEKLKLLLEPEHLLELGIVVGAWSWFYAAVLGPNFRAWPWWLWIGLLIFLISGTILGLQVLAGLWRALREWKPSFSGNGKRKTPTAPLPAMDTPRPQLDDKTIMTQ